MVQKMILFLYKHPQNSFLTILVIRFRLQFYQKKKFLSLYSNMAAPNVNGRRHFTVVYQKSPASLHSYSKQKCHIFLHILTIQNIVSSYIIYLSIYIFCQSSSTTVRAIFSTVARGTASPKVVISGLFSLIGALPPKVVI